MKKKVQKIESEIEKRLMRLCDGLSPTKRLIVVIAVCTTFSIVSIYFVVSSVLAINKGDTRNENIQINHIEGLKIPDNDSIKLLKQKNK